jgi:proteic killer suppression protein
MEIIFKTQLLADLFEKKKVNDKMFKSNPSLIDQYIKTVNKLRSAIQVEQLYQLKSLNYEHLKGNRHGHCSVRINDQFRLIFEEMREGNKVTLLVLEEISKHYE